MSSQTPTYSFEATIQEGRNGGAYVQFPYDLKAEFGRGRVKIQATFDGVPYRGSLVVMSGMPILGMTKDVRRTTGKTIGDVVQVELREDTEERTVAVPEDLAEALTSAPGAKAKFDSLAFTYRKEFAKWITDARKVETRERRLKKAIDMIINGERL